MSLIKIGLRSLKPAEKLVYANRISKGMKSTPEFAIESELIGKIDTARQALDKSIAMAAFGDKRALETRRANEKELDDLLRKAAAFANMVANGDTEMIKNAGFELRVHNNKPRRLSNPINFQVRRTDTSGELLLSWKPVKNSRNYLIQIRTAKPKKGCTWQSSAFSTRCRSKIDSLKPGKIYWIRILAVGTKGVSPPSETIEIMAA